MRVWIAISALLALLAGAIYVGYVGWNSTDVEMPVTGYVAMTLGIIFSLALGVGLMGLMFYSSRHGYDEPPSEPRSWSLRDLEGGGGHSKRQDQPHAKQLADAP